MSIFTDAELEYLQSGATRWGEYNVLLGRLATVGPDGAPHVVPLGVVVDPETDTIVLGADAEAEMVKSKKFRDAQRNPAVAIVIDDLETADPWVPRFIEIRGHAETFTEGGEEVGKHFDDPMPWDSAWIRVRPRRILTLGITGPYEFAARDVRERT